ncbi:hypothetical protein V2T44_04360 [Serratia ficaria]|uniref:Uncharacterized protein n=1 Tax=Serratia ficaria TaxID=61651 RepID=A0A240C0J2_SERFI|nr:MULTISPECIES: hypothetical protein [Serratia]MEE4482202.1 hypothetical protein [Serratia ficaria]REF44710.1 hypothetical protein C7332_3020 [Serratia ficaria]CAI0700967.1 Uncharacterised protein [Serratia ficaria]CAI0807902.1 Uncharacterised protein [Serratia ficaria]CAI0814327.1 Uncharacterised protein [Serratia ficaria]
MQSIHRFWALLSDLLIEKADEVAPQAAESADYDDALPPRIERSIQLADRFLFM